MIDQETVQKLIDGGKGLTELTLKGTTTLINEALNILLLEAVLGVVKFAAVFVVFFLVKKFVDSMMEMEEDKKKLNNFKALKVSALIISITFFVYKSFPHVVDAGKIMVAPNVFLMEKGYDILKKEK